MCSFYFYDVSFRIISLSRFFFLNYFFIFLNTITKPRTESFALYSAKWYVWQYYLIVFYKDAYKTQGTLRETTDRITPVHSVQPLLLVRLVSELFSCCYTLREQGIERASRSFSPKFLRSSLYPTFILFFVFSETRTYPRECDKSYFPFLVGEILEICFRVQASECSVFSRANRNFDWFHFHRPIVYNTYVLLTKEFRMEGKLQWSRAHMSIYM